MVEKVWEFLESERGLRVGNNMAALLYESSRLQRTIVLSIICHQRNLSALLHNNFGLSCFRKSVLESNLDLSSSLIKINDNINFSCRDSIGGSLMSSTLTVQYLFFLSNETTSWARIAHCMGFALAFLCSIVIDRFFYCSNLTIIAVPLIIFFHNSYTWLLAIPL